MSLLVAATISSNFTLNLVIPAGHSPVGKNETIGLMMAVTNWTIIGANIEIKLSGFSDENGLLRPPTKLFSGRSGFAFANGSTK